MAVPPPPLDAKYFDLQFPGINAQFKDVQGVSVSVPLHTSATTDAQGQPIRQRTASAVEYGSITCSAGATADLGLDQWIAAVADKGLEGNEKDGTLTLFSAANTRGRHVEPDEGGHHGPDGQHDRRRARRPPRRAGDVRLRRRSSGRSSPP